MLITGENSWNTKVQSSLIDLNIPNKWRLTICTMTFIFYNCLFKYEMTKLRQKFRKSSVLKLELILIWRYHQQTMFICLNILEHEMIWVVTSKIYFKNQIFIFLGNHLQMYFDFKPNHNLTVWLNWNFGLEFTYSRVWNRHSSLNKHSLWKIINVAP